LLILFNNVRSCTVSAWFLKQNGAMGFEKLENAARLEALACDSAGDVPHDR
jgi:hypothetical protein